MELDTKDQSVLASRAAHFKEIAELLRSQPEAINELKAVVERHDLDFIRASYVFGEACRQLFDQGSRRDYVGLNEKYKEAPKHEEPRTNLEKAWELYSQIEHEELVDIFEISRYLGTVAANRKIEIQQDFTGSEV
jgi:hypothetical protein